MAGNYGAVTGGCESGSRNLGNGRQQRSCDWWMRVRQQEPRKWPATTDLQVAGSVSVKSSLLHHRGRPLTTYDLGTVMISIIIGH
jgi:hypothetical protein